MINGTILQCFHAYLPGHLEGCSLWQRIAQDAPAIAQAGFSALWLPPMTKASGGSADMGYRAYDLYDLGEFDQGGSVATKYGDRAQLLAAIAAAYRAQLQVYGDVVLHRRHGGDGTEVLQGTPVAWRDRNRAMGPTQPIRVHSRFTFPGRGDRYSDMTWQGQHFQLANHNCIADCTAQAETLEKYTFYQLKAKPFSIDIDVRLGVSENATPACELDLDMPEVAIALSEWGQWFLRATGVNGLRLDGAKHMSPNFVRDWVQTLRQAEAPSLFIMGDCWSDQVNDLHWYIAKTNGQLSLFDVPLHYNFHRASRQESYYDLRNILHGTLIAEQPALAVTFVDNHDSQPGQLLESAVEDWFKPLAYALILLRREGYPCVFGADYWGASNQLLNRLLFARSHYAYGPQQDYFEQPNIIGWTRLGDAQHSQAVAVVISNGHGGQQWMFGARANTQFVDITGHLPDAVWTNGDGWAAFGCPRRSISVWVEALQG